MPHRILIIGDSPVSFLIAKQLDQDLARLAHVEVTLIRRDWDLTYWPDLTSLLGAHTGTDVTSQLKNILIKKAVVKQINLPDRRVVTDQGTFEYDGLILDLAPTFGQQEIEKVSQQCRRLITEVQAKIKTGQKPRWRVTFTGANTESWQLALAFASDLITHPAVVQKWLTVIADAPKNLALKEFLSRSGVNFRQPISPTPGLTIGAPTSPINNRSVRGALLDAKDSFMLNASGNPESHPEVIVVGGDPTRTSNLWRSNHILASRVTANIERFLDDKRQEPIELPQPSGLVTSAIGAFGWLGNFQSWRWGAKIIGNFDQKFYKKTINQ